MILWLVSKPYMPRPQYGARCILGSDDSIAFLEAFWRLEGNISILVAKRTYKIESLRNYRSTESFPKDCSRSHVANRRGTVTLNYLKLIKTRLGHNVTVG